MKHFTKIVFLLFILWINGARAQRDLTIHFLNKINQSNYSNPSFIPENNFSIGLPVLSAISLDLSNSGFKVKDLYTKQPDGTLLVNMNNLIDNVLQKSNYLSTEFTTDLLAVKFKVKGLYLGLNVTERISLRFAYPKDLIELAWRGNGGFMDRKEAVNIGLNLDANHYREYGISGALKIKKFTVGARLKLLTGFANVTTEKSDITLLTNPDDYGHTVHSDFLINTSLPNSNFNPMTYATNFNNKGLGIDLGGTFQMNEKISFAASVVDFGFINWKSDVKNYKSNANYNFDGVSFDQLSDSTARKAIVDTLKNRFAVKQTSNSYTTMLTPKIYLSGSFKLTKNDKFGMLFYSEYYHKLHPALTLAYNRDFGRWFTGGLTYSMFNSDFFNIGVGTGFKLGPVQIYIVQDNILGIFLPQSTNNYNFRFGINLVFGKPKETTPLPSIPGSEPTPKKITNENE